MLKKLWNKGLFIRFLLPFGRRSSTNNYQVELNCYMVIRKKYLDCVEEITSSIIVAYKQQKMDWAKRETLFTNLEPDNPTIWSPRDLTISTCTNLCFIGMLNINVIISKLVADIYHRYQLRKIHSTFHRLQSDHIFRRTPKA